MMLPGEQKAVDMVCAMGAQFGYGNLINRLKNAWSEMLQREHDFDKESADRAAGHYCPWCGVDYRTGELSGDKPLDSHT